MHLVNIIIFSLYDVIVKHTKIIKRADKNWAYFYKIKHFKTQSFQKMSLIKVGLVLFKENKIQKDSTDLYH